MSYFTRNFLEILFYTFLLQFFSFNSLFAAYNASSLYNSVSRAETVEKVYLERWDYNKERNFYFDWYGKISVLEDMNINTYDQNTGKYKSTDMDLKRTYGSLAIAVPITGFRKSPDDRDLVISLNTAGFHYGLTRDVDLRGPHGGEYATDYKYTQFFDDIFALSVLWRPVLIVHTGLILNNEYMANDSGEIDIADPEKSSKRFFYSFELFNIFTFRTNIKEDGIESLKLHANINKLAEFFIDVSNIYYPVFTAGFETSRAYNDEPYDAVWVDSPEGKNDNASFSKDSAMLSVASIGATQRIAENFSFEGFYALQYINKDIYSKTDRKKISPPATKEWYMRLNYDPFKVSDDFKSDLYLGISWYWEPGISIQRNSHGKGNGIYGWETGYMLDLKYVGGEIRVQHNFSSELKKLMEAADKYSWEISLFIRI